MRLQEAQRERRAAKTPCAHPVACNAGAAGAAAAAVAAALAALEVEAFALRQPLQRLFRPSLLLEALPKEALPWRGSSLLHPGQTLEGASAASATGTAALSALFVRAVALEQPLHLLRSPVEWILSGKKEAAGCITAQCVHSFSAGGSGGWAALYRRLT